MPWLRDLLHFSVLLTTFSLMTCSSMPRSDVTTEDLNASREACPAECECSMVNSTSMLSGWCAHRNLTHIPSPFSTQLFFLDLASNHISSLDPGLASLTNLHILNLTLNSIRLLPSKGLANLRQLRVLDLSLNSVAKISSNAFENLAQLMELNLANNQISQLDRESLSGLAELGVFNLRGNNLSVLANSTFSVLAQLYMLDLSHNRLEQMGSKAFQGLVSLQRIYLQYNCLQNIDPFFSDLPNLQFLDLSHNQLTLPKDKWLPATPSLHYLDLSFNAIDHISSHFFSSMPNLQVLNVSGNLLSKLEQPLFQKLEKLQTLDLTHMPYLASLSYDAFKGAITLSTLNISHNSQLSFIHPLLLFSLPKLSTLDIRCNNISTLSEVTFQANTQLTQVYLADNPLLCKCGLAWLIHAEGQYYTKLADKDLIWCFRQLPLDQITQDSLQCRNVSLVNITVAVSAKIGSQLSLRCDYNITQTDILTWVTPHGQEFHYHPFHPRAIEHLPSYQNMSGIFHHDHVWHKSASYQSNLQDHPQHIILQSDGSLFLDYVLRSDAGSYKCLLHNAHYNTSASIILLLDYQVLFEVKVMSILVGMGCAWSFLALNIIYVVIMWIARHLINKRRREAIRCLLESLDDYRTTQISRIRGNYSNQLGRIRDHYHLQATRLRDNYSTQMKRVRKGCSNQVDKIRDNYHSGMGHLKDYSCHQIGQIRDVTNHQIVRIRDYGILQMERLRENYKLQQQHVIKVLEAMNLEKCRSVVETECMHAESVIIDYVPELEEEDDMSNATPCEEEDMSNASPCESVYATAFNSDVSSQDSLVTVVENNGILRVELSDHTVLVTVQMMPQEDDIQVVSEISEETASQDCVRETIV